MKKITVKPHQPARLWDDTRSIIAEYITSQPKINGKPISINRAINELILKNDPAAAELARERAEEQAR